MAPEDVGTILRELGRMGEQLDEIEKQVKNTNGRVTEIELSRATERGAALQRAATIEDVRQTRATDLAKNAWVKPGVLSAATAVVVVALEVLSRHL